MTTYGELTMQLESIRSSLQEIAGLLPPGAARRAVRRADASLQTAIDNTPDDPVGVRPAGWEAPPEDDPYWSSNY